MSPDEQVACRCVSANRLNLRRFLEEFVASAQMLKFLEVDKGPPSANALTGDPNEYRLIAAKTAAMSIYHFGRSLDALRATIPHCPRMAGHFDGAKLAAARDAFDAQFPNVENVRHALTDAGDLWADLAAIGRSHSKGGYKLEDLFVSSHVHQFATLAGDTCQVFWDGTAFELKVRLETAGLLTVILAKVDEAVSLHEA